MGKEYERRFFSFQLPEHMPVVSKNMIYQTYLVPGDEEEVRIRKIESLDSAAGNIHYTLTHKYRPTDEENEFEMYIPQTYEHLLSQSGSVPLQKIRTTYQWRKALLAVDDYTPANIDLSTLEIEFPSKYERDSFQPPNWFGKEITGMRKFKNKNLWLSIQNW